MMRDRRQRGQDLAQGETRQVSFTARAVRFDQLTYIVLKGPDVKRIRILDGAGLVI